MLDLLLTLTQTAHLLAMNLAMAGPLYCIWLCRRATRHNDTVADELGHRLAQRSWQALLAGIVLGLVIAGILHIPGEEWFEELLQLPHGRIFWGGMELLFSLVLMLLYAALWKRMARRPWVLHLLAFLVATNLIYHFPTLFVIFAKLRNAGALAEPVSRETFRGLLLDAEVVSRSVHYILAAIAVTGAVVMGMAARRIEGEGDEAEQASAGQIVAGAARVALAITVIQLPVGVWVLLQLPIAEREEVMGQDLWAGGLLLSGVLAAVLLLHNLAAVSFGETERGKIRASIAWMLVTVLLMTGMLVRLREPGPLRESAEEELGHALARCVCVRAGAAGSDQAGIYERDDQEGHG